MQFTSTFNHYFGSMKTVVFLAFSLIFAQQMQAQDVKLTPRNGNALYVGVDNPIQVTVPGIPGENIYIGSDGIGIEKLENGLFNIRVDQPGKVVLTVHGDGFQYKNFEMEAKAIPDPMAALKFENGMLLTFGEMAADEFKKAVGVGFETNGFKGVLSIDIAKFNLVRVPKEGDASEVPVNSANFNEKAKSLINSAVSGDRFYFEHVMATVEGTPNLRQMNSLVFTIK